MLFYRFPRLCRSLAATCLALALLVTLLVTVGRPSIVHAGGPCVNPGGTGGCFASIQDAIDAASDGDQISIAAGSYIESFQLDVPVSLIGAGSDVTILEAEPGNRVMQVTGSEIDSSVTVSGLTFTGGDVTGDVVPYGGGILLAELAEPQFEDVVIAENRAENGGGLYATPEITVRLDGVSVISNTATADGGGIFAGSPTDFPGITGNAAVIVDSHFTGNVAGDFAGALATGGEVTLVNTDFSRNSARQGGVGVAITTTLTGGLIEDNEGAEALGGFLAYGPALIEDATFLRNRGGIVGALGTGVTTTITGSRFEANVSVTDNAGALFAAGILGPITVSDTIFVSNTAGGMGGAVLVGNVIGAPTAVATFTNSRFERNVAGDANANGGGGGIYAHGEVTLDHTDFISNAAVSGLGGGFAYTSTIVGGRFQGNTSNLIAGGWAASGPLVVDGTEFVDNQAGVGGGLLGVVTSTLNNTRFDGNVAAVGNGGAFLAGGGGPVIIEGSEFFANSAANAGGAVHLGDDLGVGLMSQGLPRSLFHQAGKAFSLNAPVAPNGAAESRIVNSVFGRNDSAGGGAAINLAAPHSVSVLHNTIVGPDDADGITVEDGSAAILNTIIGDYTTGIRESGGSVTADYNLFFGNGSNTSGSVTLGSNNLTGDPAFANPAQDDYHLTEASEAIDAGTDAGVVVDWEGDMRPFGPGFDIGADEFVSSPTAVYLSQVLATSYPADIRRGLGGLVSGALLVAAGRYAMQRRRK